MKNRHTAHTKVMVIVAVLGVFLASCGSGGKSAPNTLESAGAWSAAQPIEKSPPQQTEPPETSETSSTQPTATALPETTAETPPTLAPGPPVFDRQTLGSNLTLANFIVTISVANTNSGQLAENITTSGYVNDPPSFYELATFGEGDTDRVRRFIIGGRSYEENQFGDWYLYEVGSGDAPNYTGRLDLRVGTVAGVVTADFDGQADIGGIPANHFVFDQTDLANYSSYTPERPAPAAEGDFYLAQDGNYVLYSHSKVSSPYGVYEVTESLSFIGLLTEIALPAELVPMTQALDLGVELAGLLPPGSSLSTLIRYRNGIGVDSYTYKSSLRSYDEFLNFYRTFAPINGWTVTHIGHIRLHEAPINCETSVDCVILTNNGEQLVVSYRGTIVLEYDHGHVFSPA